MEKFAKAFFVTETFLRGFFHVFSSLLINFSHFLHLIATFELLSIKFIHNLPPVEVQKQQKN